MTPEEQSLHEFILAMANRLADAAEVLGNLAEKRSKRAASNLDSGVASNPTKQTHGKRPESHATLRCPRCNRQVWKPVSEDKAQYGWRCLSSGCSLFNRVGFPVYNADGTLSAFAKRMDVTVSEDDGQPE